jgi:hypothetical protein
VDRRLDEEAERALRVDQHAGALERRLRRRDRGNQRA